MRGRWENWEKHLMASAGKSSDDYDRLPKERLEELERQVRREMTERIRRETLKGFEDAVSKEVDRRFESLKPELLKTTREELTEEQRKAQPSSQERARCKSILREFEVECLVMAQAASEDTDRASKMYASRRRLGWAVMLTLLLGFLPALCYLHYHSHSYDTFLFWATAIPWVTAFIAACIIHDIVLTKHARDWRAYGSEYRQLALTALADRKVKVDSAQYRYELHDLVEPTRRQINQLHGKYSPSMVQIESARRHVRDSILEDMDPETLIRVGVEENDADAAVEQRESTAGEEPGGVRRASRE